MKNVLIIDARNHCECNAVAYDNEKKNSVFLHILADVSLSPRLEIAGKTVAVNDVYFVYELSSDAYFGSGTTTFRIVDDQTTGTNFTITKTASAAGQMTLTRKSNFAYSVGFDIMSIAQIPPDVFRNGGSNYNFKPNQYFTGGNYCADLGNSDLVRANAIWMNDTANTESEGLMFLRNGGALSEGIENYTYNANDWMCLRAYEDELLFMNKFVLHKGYTNKSLWSGNWSKDTITIPESDQYSIFLIRTVGRSNGSGIGTVIIAIRYGTWLRGMGGYSTATPTPTHYYFNAQATSSTSTTFNFIECTSQRNDGSSTYTLAVIEIIGLL